LAGIAGAQDVQLYTEDFESGGLSFSLNGGGPGSNTGNSQWIINNQYNGGGTFPNTTLQNVTAGGTIGFAPQSNYLHIHDAPSGVTNNNYVNTTSADRFAYMTSGICTFGLEDVHLSFFFLCEGCYFPDLEVGSCVSARGTIHLTVDKQPYINVTEQSFKNCGQ
jgi:hypothetical protein